MQIDKNYKSLKVNRLSIPQDVEKPVYGAFIDSRIDFSKRILLLISVFLFFDNPFCANRQVIMPWARYAPRLGSTQTQVSHSNQVIGRNRQGKVPRDLLGASVASLS